MTPKSYALNDVSIAASAKISQSSEARHLQDAFGFVGADVSSELVRDLSFQLTSGKLTLICGASGSGKSLLLRACADLLKGNERGVRTDGSLIDIRGSVDTSAVVAELPALAPDKTPLELKGRVPLDQFLNVTAKCGLAEPQLFVRPLSSLSSGQQYRLQVALAFLERPDVVVIDNFCEPLDRFTALAVIRGIKQLASELGVAVLAATASYDRLSKLPGIDQAVLLRRGDRPIVTEHIGPDDLQEGFLLEPLPSEGAK
ncbi:ATP-binding cassette domain-containing protein [Caulobacter sp. 73W]|uniref:ATP-binding cassette domain-containing protein n=1 Tax=Caulobacter sp. 73W TaxID=3161137 RepID=A0AB39KS05_9CAUL